jgi:predicted NBD/HSP70 family sugar kinase
MRRINPHNFRLARRSTSRDINRRIALNLIREHQPISRADLARRMNTTRGVVGGLVAELITRGLIYEGAWGDVPRGRKPVFLYVRTQDRLVVAVDVRVSRIYLMLSDFGGQQIALETFDPILSPADFVRELSEHIVSLLQRHNGKGLCEGIGVAIPGMVENDTGRILNAPPLGWRNVDIRESLAAATGLPVFVEGAGKACALAQMWLHRGNPPPPDNFIYISVSDGVGTGVVINGELVRGHNQIAGEFGHMPVSFEGPSCVCGATGCWMAYISNLATVSRYNLTSHKGSPTNARTTLTIHDVITRARSGDVRALETIQATGRYLGMGLVTIIHGLNPACVYIGGEITAAWDLIEPEMRRVLAERALTEEAARTVIRTSAIEHPRLHGAAALVVAPTFAAPRLP